MYKKLLKINLWIVVCMLNITACGNEKIDIENNGQQEIIENIEIQTEENFETESIQKISMVDAYDEIIEKYKEACSIEESEWFSNLEYYHSKYKALNTEILTFYHTSEHYDDIINDDMPIVLVYTYYDIDHNGVLELIIAMGITEVLCFDIYTYDGTTAVKLFENEDIHTSYQIYTNGIISKYQDDIAYYMIDSTGCRIVEVEDIDVMEQLECDGINEEWTILAEDVVAERDDSNESNDREKTNISKEELCDLVADFYNQMNNTNVYVVFSEECTETEDGYFIMLRSKAGNSANVLVAGVSVNINTGQVTDDMGNSWNFHNLN